MYAVRVLRRHPAASLTAILTLALGIGLNAAVFSVVRNVLWRSLPLPASDRFVEIGAVTEFDPSGGRIPPAAFLSIQRDSRTFDRLAGGQTRALTVVAPGEPAQLAGIAASEGMFELLGLRPAMGRPFVDADFALSRRYWRETSAPFMPPTPSVILLSDNLWRTRFGADPDVVGRTLTLRDGGTATVIGVMPPEVESLGGLFPVGFWVPETPNPRSETAGVFIAMGRLAPGVSLAQAQSELDVLGRRLTTPRGSDAPQHSARPSRSIASCEACARSCCFCSARCCASWP